MSRRLLHTSAAASICLIAWCMSFPISGYAQADEQKNLLIEQLIEDIASSLDEGQELDYTNLFEDLAYYYEHPINVNSARPEELRELFILTDIQIANLQRHIDRYGSLRSIYELQAVDDFDLPTIRKLAWFVTAQPVLRLENFQLSDFFKNASHDLFLRYKRNLQLQDGFIPDPATGVPDYAGSPDYLYTRYRLNYKKSFRAGFTLEKDAGETMQKGPDFYSAHAMYSGQTWLKQFVVGDYQALFGQGLTCWNGLAFGKSPFISNVKRNGIGLRPYSSVQETNFFRGAAATIGKKNIELTAFLSDKRIDGNASTASEDSLLTDDEFIVSSLPVGGLHRTDSEIANKNLVREQSFGGHARYSHRMFSFGATALHTRTNALLLPNTDLYAISRFSGSENSVIGADYQAVLGNANFFGEAARSANGGVSMLHGFVAALHPSLTLSAVWRFFGNEFQNNKANVFGENSLTASNERALYTGIQANLSNKFTLTAYADLIRYPWLRYRVDAPSVATDYLAQLNYKPDKKNEIYLRYRRRTNVLNTSNTEAIITYPSDVVQENWRINGSYQVHPNVQLRSRAEWSLYTKEGEQSRGFVIYQDLNYKRLGSRATFTLRYALMDCPDWNARIYAYENDVLYAFSILPYTGRGSRMYGMIKWDVARGVDLWVRYGAFLYNQTRVITGETASPNELIKSDIHLQLRLQF
jgi:hypothetical protein